MNDCAERIRLERSGHLAFVTIDRPRRRGALDDDAIDAFTRILDGLDAARTRAVILSGTGDASFCAGYDIAGIDPDQPADLPLPDERFERVVNAVSALSCPVVCALNGDAYGGGLDLALACDYVLSVPDARMAMTPCRLGLVYSASGLARFVTRIGLRATRRLFSTALPLGAAEAHRLGLIDEIVEASLLLSRAKEIAQDIARNAPLAVAGTRRALFALEASFGPDSAMMTELRATRLAALRSRDLREALAAFEEKRSPTFKGD